MKANERQRHIASNFRALSSLLEEECGLTLQNLTPKAIIGPQLSRVTRATAEGRKMADGDGDAPRFPKKRTARRLDFDEDTHEAMALRPRNESVRVPLLCYEVGTVKTGMPSFLQGKAAPRQRFIDLEDHERGECIYDIGNMVISEPAPGAVWYKGSSVRIAWESADGVCPSSVRATL